eukprot:m51a1_g13512 hypothetical protein (318) ;mRNA; r:102-1055
MYNVVHGVKLQLCQWTGETIKKRFRMPLPRNKGWTGCYGSPGVVVSAIVQNGNNTGLSVDEINEQIDMFESSLRREPGFEQVKFTIIPAPNYKLLKNWGGNLTLEEFHQQYQHDESVDMYKQVIPDKMYTETFVDVDTEQAPARAPAETTADEGTGTDSDSDSERQPNAPKRWRRSVFSITGKDEAKSRIQMPRCSSAWIEFLRAQAEKTSCPEAVVLYLHPHQGTIMGLGNPKDWGEDGNKAASHALGKSTVFGDCVVLHKNKIRERKKRAVGPSTGEETGQPAPSKKPRTEDTKTPTNTPVETTAQLVDSIVAAL